MKSVNHNHVKITALKAGPLMVEGFSEVFNSSEQKLKEADKVFLCRCGQSGKKPFCDGSHKSAGFDQ